MKKGWKMFSIFKRLARLNRIEKVVNTSCCGVIKRVDENRELLELLKNEAPDFLDKHFWVEGWLQGQDGFLTDLMTAVEIKVPPAHTSREYPRPWPGRQFKS
jgi:hypothetical protein